jgi:hypothetical protein
MMKRDERLCERLRLVKASENITCTTKTHEPGGQFSKHSELHQGLNVRGIMIRFSEAVEILLGTTESRPGVQPTQTKR